MTNILSTPLTKFTYTQIIDKMPTRDAYVANHYFHKEVPTLNHQELYSGTIKKTRAFRSQFNILSLNFEPKVFEL